MPFRSIKQRRYLWMHHPEIAEKWTKEHGSKIVPSKKKKKKSSLNYAKKIILAAKERFERKPLWKLERKPMPPPTMIDRLKNRHLDDRDLLDDDLEEAREILRRKREETK